MTAVEWLFEQIPLEWTIKRSAYEVLQQALEMEKQQMDEMYNAGLFDAKENN